MTRTQTTVLATALAGGLLLAACGGGDDRPAATESVPASANESIAGFISYLKELVVAQSDTLDPVDVSGVVPPTNETIDPDPSI